MANSKSNSDVRVRNWSFIVYPESAPDNWQTILDELQVNWACSPLHDKDINETTNEQKKPHYHVVLTFSGKKSFSQIKAITDVLNSPIPIVCHDVKNTIKYFCHMNNPEKAQYELSDIVSHGIDIDEYLKPSLGSTRKIQQEMIQFCQDNMISEFSDFVDLTLSMGNNEWYDMLMIHHTFAFKTYFMSKRSKKNQASRQWSDA